MRGVALLTWDGDLRKLKRENAVEKSKKWTTTGEEVRGKKGERSLQKD